MQSLLSFWHSKEQTLMLSSSVVEWYMTQRENFLLDFAENLFVPMQQFLFLSLQSKAPQFFISPLDGVLQSGKTHSFDSLSKISPSEQETRCCSWIQDYETFLPVTDSLFRFWQPFEAYFERLNGSTKQVVAVKSALVPMANHVKRFWKKSVLPKIQKLKSVFF